MRQNLLSLTATLALSACAEGAKLKNINCSVDNGGRDSIQISVKSFNGSLPKDKMDYQGHEVAVGFAPGSQYESQQVLVMELDEYKTKIYDPKASLYMLEGKDSVKIQCRYAPLFNSIGIC